MRVSVVHFVELVLRDEAGVNQPGLQEVLPVLLEGFFCRHDILPGIADVLDEPSELRGIHMASLRAFAGDGEDRFALQLAVNGVQRQHVLFQQPEILGGAGEARFAETRRETVADDRAVGRRQTLCKYSLCPAAGEIDQSLHLSQVLLQRDDVGAELLTDAVIKPLRGVGGVHHLVNSLPQPVTNSGPLMLGPVMDHASDPVGHVHGPPGADLLCGVVHQVIQSMIAQSALEVIEPLVP